MDESTMTQMSAQRPMLSYIGVKILKDAYPMMASEARLKNYIRDNNLIETDGYEVTYEDGYKSWSPKDVFEKSYRSITNMTFGLAIEAMKLGHIVARQRWNGKGMFIFIRPDDKLDVAFCVEKMKSLPNRVKQWLNINVSYNLPENDNNPKIKFTSYICMKATDGSIVNGWLANQTDILAEDWIIV